MMKGSRADYAATITVKHYRKLYRGVLTCLQAPASSLPDEEENNENTSVIGFGRLASA